MLGGAHRGEYDSARRVCKSGVRLEKALCGRWILSRWSCGFVCSIVFPGLLRFGLEGFQFGPWDVSAEGIVEIFFGVAFGLLVADPDGAGLDAVRAQLLSEPLVFLPTVTRPAPIFVRWAPTAV